MAEPSKLGKEIICGDLGRLKSTKGMFVGCGCSGLAAGIGTDPATYALAAVPEGGIASNALPRTVVVQPLRVCVYYGCSTLHL